MSFSFKTLFNRIKGGRVPTDGSPVMVYALGVLNFILFGFGTAISGMINGCTEDIAIGFMQFILPFVGWVWSVIWGFLMISDKFRDYKYQGSDATPIYDNV
uniref:Transmembrane protein n=1 Tax=Theileria annulata TaxID=5874 RepID=A0A3B0N5Y7_THEAN